MQERCFSCGRIIKGTPKVGAKTSDGQLVYVGSECLKKVEKAGKLGYQPPKGGPKLFPVG